MKRISCIFFFIVLAAALVPALQAGKVTPADAEKAAVDAKMQAEAEARLKAVMTGKIPLPEIKYPVNDYANILTPADENRIARMLIDHRKKTGVQIAVLTVHSTGQMSIEEFSLKVAEKWGGGTKERDDGLLFTVADDDRRMRIEVGYGLEGYVTDIRAGRILDGIREDFKAYQYGRGIEKAVSQIIDATAECRPGEEAPVMVRLWGSFARVVDCYIAFFFAGALFAALFTILIRRSKVKLMIGILGTVLFFIITAVLQQLYFHGAWYWSPLVYLAGALVGGWFVGALTAVKRRVLTRVGTVLTAIPAVASLAAIIYCLHILKPSYSDTTLHETMLLVILPIISFIQLRMLFGVFEGFQEGGDSSSGYSSSSYGSSSSSSSSSSNSTSWSGGGGGFGGGGASSSW